MAIKHFVQQRHKQTNKKKNSDRMPNHLFINNLGKKRAMLKENVYQIKGKHKQT